MRRDASSPPVLMAVIGAPHGVRGEVRVRTFTGEPQALGSYGPLSTADGRRFTIKALRPAGTVVVVRFAEVTSREAAEALAGVELFVDRAALPPADEDEFYHADLIGLAVRGPDGAALGRVRAIQNYGGGDIVELEDGRLIPFTAAAVPAVDLGAGFLTIDPAVAGLLASEDET